jgi:hypothetical protein
MGALVARQHNSQGKWRPRSLFTSDLLVGFIGAPTPVYATIQAISHRELLLPQRSLTFSIRGPGRTQRIRGDPMRVWH